MKPTVGRIVHYRLTEAEVKRIDILRGVAPNSGNPHEVGQVVPLMIVRVWPHEYGVDVPGVNGQAILDGDFGCWVTSAREGTGPGEWCWPPREEVA